MIGASIATNILLGALCCLAKTFWTSIFAIVAPKLGSMQAVNAKVTMSDPLGGTSEPSRHHHAIDVAMRYPSTISDGPSWGSSEGHTGGPDGRRLVRRPLRLQQHIVYVYMA